jgi:hypothetical protein
MGQVQPFQVSTDFDEPNAACDWCTKRGTGTGSLNNIEAKFFDYGVGEHVLGDSFDF